VLYGIENWTIKARDTGRITAAGMEYMRKAAGIHLDSLWQRD
jgi:hypothetical protein